MWDILALIQIVQHYSESRRKSDIGSDIWRVRLFYTCPPGVVFAVPSLVPCFPLGWCSCSHVFELLHPCVMFGSNLKVHKVGESSSIPSLRESSRHVWRRRLTFICIMWKTRVSFDERALGMVMSVGCSAPPWSHTTTLAIFVFHECLTSTSTPWVNNHK